MRAVEQRRREREKYEEGSETDSLYFYRELGIVLAFNKPHNQTAFTNFKYKNRFKAITATTREGIKPNSTTTQKYLLYEDFFVWTEFFGKNCKETLKDENLLSVWILMGSRL